MNAHFDWQQTQKNCSDRAEIAQTMLEMFNKEITEYEQLLIGLKNKFEQNKAENILHKLHGSCCYIAVPRLKDKLEQFEQNSIAVDSLAIQWVLDELTNIKKSINAR